jgi:hypothetical protein
MVIQLTKMKYQTKESKFTACMLRLSEIVPSLSKIVIVVFKMLASDTPTCVSRSTETVNISLISNISSSIIAASSSNQYDAFSDNFAGTTIVLLMLKSCPVSRQKSM